jgi:hypothetical protein
MSKPTDRLIPPCCSCGPSRLRCGTASVKCSQTYAPSVTFAEIEQFPSCLGFGIDHAGAGRCAWVRTNPNSSDQVWFDCDPLG